MENIERDLIVRSQTGDRNAFGELVALYKDRIFSLAFRMLGDREEAEDVAQETFIRLFTHLHRYDETYRLSTWLFRIANNLSIDRLRRSKRNLKGLSLDAELQGTEGLALYDAVRDDSPTPEQSLLQNEVEEQIKEAIRSLSPKYRNIMILKYMEDLSIQEISEIVNLPEATVKTRLHRGREALRKKLRHI
ncbi:RNA polymerase sigma factor sigW [[Clostridium] ultunense Esp]|uniref:RNA polymerase sigma factor SigW n=1 Tax=Thermicanus aegyptius TaxID=94009 RepID=UPI0002B6FF2E|nr:RNA polymerase sigma factor SigW [Thermicanus aegyptius]CCQ94398.1 RNA polymerase sigma factor sigW [[Clostridium] ultunense Esp]